MDRLVVAPQWTGRASSESWEGGLAQTRHRGSRRDGLLVAAVAGASDENLVRPGKLPVWDRRHVVATLGTQHRS